jgi:hypothetical protein
MLSFKTKGMIFTKVWLLLWTVPCISLAQTFDAPMCFDNRLNGLAPITGNFISFECNKDFVGPVEFVWEVNDANLNEYHVEVRDREQGRGNALYQTTEICYSDFGSSSLQLLTSTYYIYYFCDNESADCSDVFYDWKMVDCGCPQLSDVAQGCDSSSFSSGKSAVCEKYCLAGEEVIGISCEKCEAGKFSNESKNKICSLCPPGTYQDSEGQVSCKPCPTGTFSDDGATQCLTSPTKPPTDIRSSGYWKYFGSGSVTGGNNVYSFSISSGVRNAQEISDTTSVTEELTRSQENGVSLETSLALGWTVGVEVGLFGTGVSSEFSVEASVTAGTSASISLSETTAQTVGREVSNSVEVFSEKGCGQSCGRVGDFSTAFGWQWIHVLYDMANEETVGIVDTCTYWCMYSPDLRPMCPPGFCADGDGPNCQNCKPGTFADEAIDRAASAVAATPAPNPAPVNPTVTPPTPSGDVPTLSPVGTTPDTSGTWAKKSSTSVMGAAVVVAVGSMMMIAM